MSSYDVIVIGAGSSGVSLAALLQNRGYDTLLVEGQEDVGGRASTFEYRGYHIDTGSHQLASFSSSGMQAVMEDVDAEIELEPVEPSLVHYSMETDEFVKATKPERFPNEQAYEDFKQFVGKTVEMSREEIAAVHDITASEWLDDNIPNDDLKEFFTTITGFAGTPLDRLSAGAFLETLHDSFMSEQTIQFPSQGGVRQFSDVIYERFRALGGESAFGVTVSEILVENGAVAGISGTKRRPGLMLDVEIEAPRVVSTIPANATFTILPRAAVGQAFADHVDEIRREAMIYGGVFAGIDEELLDRKFGDSDLQHFQFSVEPTEDLLAMADGDWHGIATVPTYINPDQAPPGYDLIYMEIHVPLTQGETERLAQFQDVALEMLRGMWDDFDEKVDWVHPVTEPNVLVTPPRVGLTGENRPGFSVPGLDGMYIAGEAAYSSGSGIGSAVKSSWGALRRILLDDGRTYGGPLEAYLELGEDPNAA